MNLLAPTLHLGRDQGTLHHDSSTADSPKRLLVCQVSTPLRTAALAKAKQPLQIFIQGPISSNASRFTHLIVQEAA